VQLSKETHKRWTQLENMYQDGQYLANNPSWHEQDSRKKAEWIEFLLKTGGVSPKSVAEVGCGAAGILRELSAKFRDCRFEGWDVSPQAVTLARSRSMPGIEVHQGDILEAGRKWDLVLAIDVLEHMENPAEFLRESRRICRHIVIHLPLDLSVQTVARGWPLLDRRKNLGHLHLFTRGLARAMVESNGWEIVQERYTGGALELPIGGGLREVFKNRILRLPRRLLFAVSPHLAVRILGGWSILLLCTPLEEPPR
jgi:SAM-dependent methyltransferase